jgi:hypothetical protein
MSEFYEKLAKKCEYGALGDGLRAAYMEGALDAATISMDLFYKAADQMRKLCTCRIVDDHVPDKCLLCDSVTYFLEAHGGEILEPGNAAPNGDERFGGR